MIQNNIINKMPAEFTFNIFLDTFHCKYFVKESKSKFSTSKMLKLTETFHEIWKFSDKKKMNIFRHLLYYMHKGLTESFNIYVIVNNDVQKIFSHLCRSWLHVAIRHDKMNHNTAKKILNNDTCSFRLC